MADAQGVVSPGIGATFISLSGERSHEVGRKEVGQLSCSGVTSSKGIPLPWCSGGHGFRAHQAWREGQDQPCYATAARQREPGLSSLPRTPLQG